MPSTRRRARATAAPSSTAPSATTRKTVRRQAAGRSDAGTARARRKAFRAARRLSGGARVLVAALRAHRALVRAMGRRAPRRHRRAACGNPRRAEIPGRQTRVHAVAPSPTASSSARTAATPSSTTRPAPPAPRSRCAPGLPPQLTLEAAILRGGGFKTVAAGSVSRNRLCDAERRRAGRRSRARSPSRKARPTRQADHALARLKELAAQLRGRSDALSLAGAPDVEDALRRLRPPRARQGMVGHRRRR